VHLTQLKGGLMKTPEFLPPLSVFGALIPQNNRSLMKAYIKWLLLLSKRGLNLKPSSDKIFNELYRAVHRNWSDKTTLGYLQQEFIKENLSLSLLLEPLQGFEWLSKNRYPLTFTGSSPIMLQIISPVARLIAALNHQHPPFYQPFANLICVYLGLYLQHMPELITLLEKARFSLNPNMPQSLPLLQNEAKRILSVTYNFLFKLRISFYLGLCQVLLQKKSHQKTNFLDYVNAILYGLWYIITIRGQKLPMHKL
jgi:hypothetical protein